MRHHDVHRQIFQTLFTEDQIEHLVLRMENGDKSKPGKYSKTTIKKALCLKFTCGNAGYDELLKQGIPLPSRRTLSISSLNLEYQVKCLIIYRKK